MALHHESAGNSAASGNAAIPGTSSLDQARDACSDEAFFIGTTGEALTTLVGQLSDLCPQLDIVVELIRSGRGDEDGPAGSLVSVARGQLTSLIDDLESLAERAASHARDRGYSHD